MDPIVTVEWLSERLDEQHDVVIVHVGTTMGGDDPAAGFRTAHLPGARFVVLDTALASPAAPVIGRHPLPSPTDLAAAMGAAGIDDESPVVAYDDRNGGWASRLVWMLRVLGQPAALLDGGLAAWTGSIETGPPSAEPVQRRVALWPDDAIVSADEVAAHITNGGVVIDSREAPRYRGDVEPIDSVAGHIPGAINLPFTDNLIDGSFRPVDEQRQRFSAVAADPQAIVYCGSGVTACHNALAIHAAGLPMPRVYVGSWSGWSTENGRPSATGNMP